MGWIRMTRAPGPRVRYNYKRFPCGYDEWHIAVRVWQSCPHAKFTTGLVATMVDKPITTVSQRLRTMARGGMVEKVERRQGPGTHTQWEFTPQFRAFMEERGDDYACV